MYILIWYWDIEFNQIHEKTHRDELSVITSKGHAPRGVWVLGMTVNGRGNYNITEQVPAGQGGSADDVLPPTGFKHRRTKVPVRVQRSDLSCELSERVRGSYVGKCWTNYQTVYTVKTSCTDSCNNKVLFTQCGISIDQVSVRGNKYLNLWHTEFILLLLHFWWSRILNAGL